MLYKLIFSSIITFLFLEMSISLETQAEHKNTLINKFCIASIKSKLGFTDAQNQALKKINLKQPITLEQIKKKYKKLVKIFHPDVNDNNKEAEEKFKEINKSYKVLLKNFLSKNESKN